MISISSTTKKALSRCLIICTMLFGLSGLQQAVASHFAAVDLEATYIGTGPTNLKYRVALTVYYACEGGASPSSPETVHWSDSALGLQYSRPFYDTTGQPLGLVLTGYCPGTSQAAQNSCVSPGSPFPGFRYMVFVDTVTLPAPDANWKFYWTNSARNGGITNGGQNASIWVEATINNTGVHYNNSTPRYSVQPVPYVCINQDNTVVNGPTDPNNDSLVTFNQVPLTTSPVTPITYSVPYTLANPFNSAIPYAGQSSPYVVNQNNGTAYFHPTNAGKYVLAFRTFSYDRYTGEQLGYISRDVQVRVEPICSSSPPNIDSLPSNLVGANIVPTNGGYQVTVCPGTPVSFTVNGASPVAASNLQIHANNAVVAPGSTFTAVGAGSPAVTATFNWAPTGADIGQHQLLITLVDSTCSTTQPVLLHSYLQVLINVLPGVDAGQDGLYCLSGPNSHPYQLSVTGPPSITYTWTAISGNTAPPYGLSCTSCINPTATPSVTTTYVVSSSDPQVNCKNSDTITVRVGVDPPNSIKAVTNLPFINGRYILCRPNYVPFDAIATGAPPPSIFNCGPSNSSFCANPDSATVGVNPVATPINQNNTPYNSSYRYQKYQFIIPKAEMVAAGMSSSVLNSLSFFSSSAVPIGPSPLVSFTISLKCTPRPAFQPLSSNLDFEQGLTQVYNTTSFINTPNAWDKFVFQQPYNWDSSQNLLVEICMGQTASSNPAGYTPVNVVPGTAIQRFSNTVNVCANVGTAVNTFTQRPQVKFDFCKPAPTQFSYTWTPGQYLSDSSIQSPIAYIPRNTSYVVSTLGANGCQMSDSFQIYVPVHHVDIIPKDTAICVGQAVRLLASGATSYQWYENGFNTPTTLSCVTCDNPTAIPVDSGDINYTVVFSDDVACNDTTTIRLHAYPLPVVHITNADTTIKYGQHVNLMVTDLGTGRGASFYTWTPVGTLSDPNIPNPVASPTENTTYVLFGDDTHYCRSTDTVSINVDYRDNLFVPTAFTPGAKANPIFHVVNLTFQRVMEFRVFNRWGQEVFSANDNHGWDGTWKGVQQDMGNYGFIIRVAFPDGFVETYKGDVTLIR